MRQNEKYAYMAVTAALCTFTIFIIIKIYTFSAYGNVMISVFFSAFLPVTFLIARKQLRNSRLHRVEVFRRTFEGWLSSSHFLEFVERKYYSGISSAGNAPAQASKPAFWGADWLSFAACLPFVATTMAGFFMLLLPSRELLQLLGGSIGMSLSGTGGTEPAFLMDYENALEIASLAFAAAFLYSLRLFFKALVNYEPFGIVFLRAFVHTLFAVMLAVMIWRAAPDAEPFARAAENIQSSIAGGNARAHAGPEQPAAAKTGEVASIWLALAFIVGFLPDHAFSWAGQRARLAVNRRYGKAARHAAVTPATVIDGIDFGKAFRLEEGNITSVQNLAAANPVMLHVETSYCIFLIMDWIGQAQLCAAVGPERFLLFRKINIRTIFDLERAVLDPASPAGLKQIVGAVLLANDGAKPDLLRDAGVRPFDMAHRDFDRALTSWVNAEVIEHLVRVTMDNLYIHRFRQIWRDIEGSLMSVKAGKRAGAMNLPAAAASPQPNGGRRDLHAMDKAAGKAASRGMQTEIQGD